MTPITTRITEILEAQQVEDSRILGIATTAAKIMEIRRQTCLSIAPQPPAPAEGAPALVDELVAAHKAWLANGYPEGAGILFRRAADAIMATERAPDVAGLVNELYERWDEDNEAGHGGRTHLCKRAAAALTAQADEIVADMAEIAAGRERAEKAEAALAAKEAEIEAQRDNIRMLEGALIDKNLRIAEIEAALRRLTIDNCGCHPRCQCDTESALRIWKQEAQEIARAALAGKEPQP